MSDIVMETQGCGIEEMGYPMTEIAEDRDGLSTRIEKAKRPERDN